MTSFPYTVVTRVTFRVVTQQSPLPSLVYIPLLIPNFVIEYGVIFTIESKDSSSIYVPSKILSIQANRLCEQNITYSSKMHFLSTIPQALAMIWLLFYLLVSLVLVNGYQDEAPNAYNKVISIGVIIDVNSRTGKEQQVAMDIAARTYNSTSKTYKLALYFQNSTKDPLRAITLG
ncbi:hypothetical protein CR513_14960, partial [Mucuna pruriens]